MNRLLFVLVVSFGSIAAGYVLQRLTVKRIRFERLSWWSSRMKLFALLVLQPVAILNAFWRLRLADAELIAFPFLGALSLVIGATTALLFIRFFHIPPFRAGSVLTSSMFTNIGVFAALIAFVLYGPLGFSLVQLFRVFEETIYYAIGFPLSQQVGQGPLNRLRVSARVFAVKPIAVAPLGAIVLGTLLKWAGAMPPDSLAVAANVIVPVMTAILGFSIGMTLRVTRLAHYRREVAMVLFAKFVVIPTILIPLAWLLGLGSVMDGVPLRVVVIASFMPTAFLALVPPALYGFDLDLANSAWLVTTLALMGIIPMLFLVLV
jgi:predicted permease